MSEYDTANEHELCFQIGKLKRRIAELEAFIDQLIEAEVTRLLTESDDAHMAEAHYIAKAELAKRDARITELENRLVELGEDYPDVNFYNPRIGRNL